MSENKESNLTQDSSICSQGSYNASQDLFDSPDSSHKESRSSSSKRKSEKIDSTERNEKEFLIDDDSKEKLASEQASSWLGTPLAFLNHTLVINAPYPGDTSSTVFVSWPAGHGGKSARLNSHPDPSSAKDKWDDYHVRMPCSEESKMVWRCPNGKGMELKKRWQFVVEALNESIKTSKDLEECIVAYNPKAKWDFTGLHEYFSDLEDNEREVFFKHTLPKIVEMCLSLQHEVTKPIPLLRSGSNYSLTFSQRQIASLLANAFFCTFPGRNKKGKRPHLSAYPDINFTRLFQFCHIEKFNCIFNYFRRISKRLNSNTEPDYLVTYERRHIANENLPNWAKSNKLLTKLHIDSEGTIEDNGDGLLQVDFANAFIGGGVLGRGCVQEEIRFLISPELILSRLFTERLGSNECLIITGFERFSDYSGYASTFSFVGDFQDKTPIDRASRHRKTRLVAIDALIFHNERDQFLSKNLRRELNKAYVGFYNSGENNPVAVATGNWGCGAFRGNPRLKSLIQLMAAAEAGRDLAYFTFGDEKLRDQIHHVHKVLVEKSISVGKLYQLIKSFNTCLKNNPSLDLYDHIYSVLNCNRYDALTTDEEEEEEEEEKVPNEDEVTDGKPESDMDTNMEEADENADILNEEILNVHKTKITNTAKANDHEERNAVDQKANLVKENCDAEAMDLLNRNARDIHIENCEPKKADIEKMEVDDETVKDPGVKQPLEDTLLKGEKKPNEDKMPKGDDDVKEHANKDGKEVKAASETRTTSKRPSTVSRLEASLKTSTTDAKVENGTPKEKNSRKNQSKITDHFFPVSK